MVGNIMNRQDNSKRQQQLSAILDNDLDQQEINEFMQDLKRDPDADAESMKRYQLVGDVLRDELNAASFMDISAAVHRAVDQEPDFQTVSSPMAAKKRSKTRLDLSTWIKPLTGMAIAASVAMVTIVSFNSIETDQANNPSAALAKANVEIKKSTIVPVNPAIASQVRLASTAESKTKAQLQAKQLGDYMMRHSNSAGQSTMHGMVPYVRAVDFDSSR